MPTLVRESLLAATDLLWPKRCLHCGEQCDTDLCICETCRKAFTEDSHNACPRCSSTIGPHADATDGCLRCQSVKYHFSSAQRLNVYDGELRSAVLNMKHRGGETLAEVLGLAWADSRRESLLKSKPQAVVAVPLHWRKRLVRGFNQAEHLARGIASGLQIPFVSKAIRRVRPTPQQSGVTATERRENLKSAFGPFRTGRVKSLRVLLIDDVLTTGATADAAAVAILAGGAAQVDVAVLAHR